MKHRRTYTADARLHAERLDQKLVFGWDFRKRDVSRLLTDEVAGLTLLAFETGSFLSQATLDTPTDSKQESQSE